MQFTLKQAMKAVTALAVAMAACRAGIDFVGYLRELKRINDFGAYDAQTKSAVWLKKGDRIELNYVGKRGVFGTVLRMHPESDGLAVVVCWDDVNASRDTVVLQMELRLENQLGRSQ